MPPARDTVGGHVGIGASAGYGVPLGSVGGASHRGLFAPGLALSADAAYGVSRTVMVGLYGALGTSDGRGPWSGGDVSSFGVGPFVRYHLVQGTRFDPWMSFGIGFRQTTVDGTSQKGIDWARIQLGGDWYAFSRLGIGPVLELAFRSFIDPPFGTADSSVNAHFVLGGRIVFDAPGK